MKLKNTSEPETLSPEPAVGAPVIADRYKLDIPARDGSAGVGKVGATIALVASLLAIALLGITAWLMYMNWDLIQSV